MKQKSILLTTYPEAYIDKGGGEYELLETALNLRKIGLNADIYGPYSQSMKSYDNILHFSILSSGFSMVQAAKKLGKKIFLWPNFWSNEDLSSSEIRNARAFFENADFIIFKSLTEKDFFSRFFPLDENRTIIIKTGIDDSFTTPTIPGLFKECFNLDKYILWTGLLEENKKQLEIIQCLKNFEIPVVFIGGYRDYDYFEACKKHAPGNYLFLDAMDNKTDLYRSAIADCSLYMEPTLEPAGKSVLEAAICGASVLLADTPWSHEYFDDYAIYINPHDKQDIIEGVKKGLELPVKEDQQKVFSSQYLYSNVLEKLRDYF